MSWFSRKALWRTVLVDIENGALEFKYTGTVWPINTILVLVYGRT
jgi:hypothetical protein